MNLENYFISQFQSKQIGDDAALADGFIYSKDAFFEDVHFKKKWMSHYQIAVKAMMVNISDAVAMNARPKYALLSVAMPWDITKKQMRDLARGFQESAARFGIEIIGGDTISNHKLAITITVISETKKPLLRKGLRKGHLVAYTGEIGKSAKDLKKLMNLGKIHKNSKFVHIKLREKFVARAIRYVSCGMDISDGLFSDLGKLASLNRVGFKLYKPIAKRAACSGEEYEILFGFDKREKKTLMRIAKVCRTPVTIVGESTRKSYKSRCRAHHF